MTAWMETSLRPARSVRRHEDREPKTGEMVQRLIDPDQRPEPWMLILLRHAKCRCANSLGAVDRDMNDKVDDGDEPEPWRDNQDQRHGYCQMHQTVRQQRQCPTFFLVLANRHPGGLQYEIRADVLECQEQHPPYQRTDSNRRRHGGKQQSRRPLLGLTGMAVGDRNLGRQRNLL